MRNPRAASQGRRDELTNGSNHSQYITTPASSTTSRDIDTVLTSAAQLAEEARALAADRHDRRMVRFAFDMHRLTVALHAIQERSVAAW